jgi:hypothetical protein
VIDRAHVPAAVVTSGAGLALIGTFLPWLRSGSVDRSSYEIFDLVERLGFSPNGVVAWVLRLWPLVPLLLACSAIALWLRPSDPRVRRALAVLPIASALVLVGTALVVSRAPDVGLFRVGIGPWCSVAGAVLMVAGVCCVRGRRGVARG